MICATPSMPARSSGIWAGAQPRPSRAAFARRWSGTSRTGHGGSGSAPESTGASGSASPSDASHFSGLHTGTCDVLNVEPTAIADVKIVTPKRFGDDRGFFSEVYNGQRFVEAGITAAFL